ncbi:META domain-containing protein [Hydrogenimonas sp.]
MAKGLWSVLIAILFVFEGCAVEAMQNHEPCQKQLVGTGWRLVMIDNDPIELKRPATIRFESEGKISGFSGCNSYFGKVTLDGTSITFGPIGSTRKYCMGKAGDVEKRLFALFKGTKWWNFDEERNLQIFDDEHRLIFVKSE